MLLKQIKQFKITQKPCWQRLAPTKHTNAGLQSFTSVPHQMLTIRIRDLLRGCPPNSHTSTSLSQNKPNTQASMPPHAAPHRMPCKCPAPTTATTDDACAASFRIMYTM